VVHTIIPKGGKGGRQEDFSFFFLCIVTSHSGLGDLAFLV
jgi:hypothetical protein